MTSTDLVKDHLPLLYKYVSRLRHLPFDRDELVNVGVIGYFKALKRFDPSKNVPFGGYAIYWAKEEISLYIRRYMYSVSIPDTTAYRHNTYTSYSISSLLQEEHPYKLRKNTDPLSPIHQCVDAIKSRENPLITAHLERELEKVPKALAELPFKQRYCVTERFFNETTLQTLAKELNVSAEAVRQIQQKALKTLQEHIHYVE